MLQKPAKSADLFVWIEIAPRMRVAFRRCLRRQLDLAGTYRLLVPHPDIIQSGVINQTLENDIPALGPMLALDRLLCIHFTAGESELDAIAGIVPIQPRIRAGVRKVFSPNRWQLGRIYVY